MKSQKALNDQQANPWYREPWAWMLLVPLVAVVIMSTLILTLAVRHGDDTVSDTYYKDSRMYHYSAHQDERAQELGLAGLLQFSDGSINNAGDAGEVVSQVTLDLTGELDYPQQLMLTLSHPVEADLDQYVLLKQISVGRYQGDVQGKLNYRWYLLLTPESDPANQLQAEWRLKSEINFSLGRAVPLKPAQLKTAHPETLE